MLGNADSFNPFAPGFDFLKKLAPTPGASNAGSFPQWNEWVAPTMNVPDLEKRLNELKTVLFWLQQNQRALEATIQALEVQKMTLSALQTMNVPVENWASTVVQSWQKFAQTASAAGVNEPAAAEQAASPQPAVAPEPAPPVDEKAVEPEAGHSATADPVQWWGALTQQFQSIAQQAMQDVTHKAMQHAEQAQQTVSAAAASMASGVGANAASAAAPSKAKPAARSAKSTAKPVAKSAAKPAAKAPAKKASKTASASARAKPVGTTARKR